jgi:hypothetical protein
LTTAGSIEKIAARLELTLRNICANNLDLAFEKATRHRREDEFCLGVLNDSLSAVLQKGSGELRFFLVHKNHHRAKRKGCCIHARAQKILLHGPVSRGAHN